MARADSGMRRVSATMAILAAASATAGCVGPNFVPPIPVTADSRNFLDTGKAVRSPIPVLAGTSSAVTEAQWWRIFRDPKLTQLEARVAEENLDVRTATLRVAESRAQVASTAAAALPTLNGTANDYHEAFSQNSLFKLIPIQALSGGSGTGGGSTSSANQIITGFNNYSVGFDASWELDLWGHVARQVEAADAQYLGMEEMRRNTLVSTYAELARDYVTLRGTQLQLRIVKDNLKIEEEILGITKVRQSNGLVTGLDVETAASQVDSVRAQIPQLQAQEVSQINMISLLLDQPPLGLSQELIDSRAVPPNPPVVPIGLPSELARRRPDIRVAEANLHAATANIGVAVAEFYPSVRLNGSPTLQALAPKDLFKGTSLQYMNIGPSVTLPIFEGGRLKSNLVLQEKTQQAMAIAYHQAVLNAWHDVINQLTSYRTEQIRRERLNSQVGHARAALTLARSRYEQGVADFTTLLTDEQTVLNAEQQQAQSTTNVSTDLVALYKALGGGWELTYPDPKAKLPPLVAAVVPAGPIPVGGARGAGAAAVGVRLVTRATFGLKERTDRVCRDGIALNELRTGSAWTTARGQAATSTKDASIGHDVEASRWSSPGRSEGRDATKSRARSPVRASSLLAASLALSACADFGHRELGRDQVGYSRALTESQKEQTLLNVVRLRYGDVPSFLNATQVIAGYQLQRNVSLSAEAFPALAMGTFLNPGASVQLQQSPTFTFQPSSGQAFAQSYIPPLSPAELFPLSIGNLPIDVLLRLTLTSLGPLRNESVLAGEAGEATDFLRVLAELRRLQLAGRPRDPTGRRRRRQGRKAERDAAARDRLPGYRERGPCSRISRTSGDGWGYDGSRGRSRSCTGRTPPVPTYSPSSRAPSWASCRRWPSTSTSPDADVASGATVPSTIRRTEGLRPTISIHSGPERPEDAFASVGFRGKWFWIDDRDFDSKLAFGVVLLLIVLAQTPQTAGAVVTVPAR